VNALKDLAPITKLVAIPNFILGSAKLPAQTLMEALAYAKARPGQLPVSLSASPAEFAGFVLAEAKKWEKIIRDNNVRID
jgi:tripartite-type tricarboxylate transporter receptor subunit TctC